MQYNVVASGRVAVWVIVDCKHESRKDTNERLAAYTIGIHLPVGRRSHVFVGQRHRNLFADLSRAQIIIIKPSDRHSCVLILYIL